MSKKIGAAAKKLARGESIVARMTSFWPFSETIGKWLDIFYMERARKKMSLHYPIPSSFSDPLRPKITADEDLFEMLLYNLLNNAEKYGHRGSRIHLDFCLESDDGKTPNENASYVLTVTDYGVAADGGEDMFKPFTRTNKSEDGLGVGLDLARKIMIAHRGRVEFVSSEKISRYNIPLLGPAVRMGEAVFKDRGYRNQLEAEFRRLNDSGIYDDAVLHDSLCTIRYSMPRARW